jgi:hypothetical protein
MADEQPKRRRRWWLVALVVVVAWVVAISVMTLTAKHHAETGLAEIKSVDQRSTGGIDQLVDSLAPTTDGGSDLPAALRAATDEFRNATDLLGSPVMAPARILPVAGRQLRAARALSSAATTVGGATAEAYDSLSTLLTTKTTQPDERLAAGRKAETVLRRLQTQIAHVDLGPGNALVGALASARRRFSNEYGRVKATNSRAIDAVAGLNSFLTGPTSYVLLASNNGEMRSGGGSYLQVGLLTVQNAKFSITELNPTRSLVLAQPGAVMDPDVAKNWGWLQPNQEWRNLNLTPRYDESARMATEMWVSQGHPPVQGAINIDVAGLKAILGVVGAVQVDGLTLDQNNVEKYLLLDQYKDFGQDIDLRPIRDEHLAAVAKAALEAFNSKAWSTSDLLHSLLQAGQDRHIMLWSSDATQEKGWKAVGADGEIPSNGLMLSIINRGGNKLDQFLKTDADVVVHKSKTSQQVKVTVHMTNVTPNGLPRYVQGPYPHFLGAAGTYFGIVQLSMPGAAGAMTMSGGQQAVYGDDGPSRVMGVQLSIPRDQTGTVEFDFTLPTNTKQMTLLPSARLPATTWTLSGRNRPITDGGAHLVLMG